MYGRKRERPFCLYIFNFERFFITFVRKKHWNLFEDCSGLICTPCIWIQIQMEPVPDLYPDPHYIVFNDMKNSAQIIFPLKIWFCIESILLYKGHNLSCMGRLVLNRTTEKSFICTRWQQLLFFYFIFLIFSHGSNVCVVAVKFHTLHPPIIHHCYTNEFRSILAVWGILKRLSLKC